MQHDTGAPDPAIITTLLAPLRQVRATLGPATEPDDALLWALRTTATRAADTDLDHSAGLRTLMSGWSTTAEDTATPVLHTTREELGTIAEDSPQYATLLQNAYRTNAEAAADVDAIISRFRREARGIAAAAQTTADSDRITALATRALDDALSVVETARTRMRGYTDQATALHPEQLRTVAATDGTEPNPALSARPAGSPATTPAGWGGPTGRVPVPGQGVPAAVPVDPMVLVQTQLQSQLIAAGVKLGTSLIDAGVKLGTTAIDKGATLAGKAIDAAAKTADSAIREGTLKLPSPTGTPAPAPGPGSAAPPAIDFGAAPPKTEQPAPAPAETGPAAPAVVPTAPVAPPPPPAAVKPAPAPNHGPSPAPAPVAPVAPVAPPTEQEHKRRSGQLGVTVPVPASGTGVIEPAPPQP